LGRIQAGLLLRIQIICNQKVISMKHSSKFLLALASTTLALAAHAGSGIQASEVPRITNGGTGVIGGVEPDAYPRNDARPMTQGMGAGAQPQAQAQATTAMGGRADSTRMGGNRWSVPSIAPASNPSWGTPY
jgi:hypothetical protein